MHGLTYAERLKREAEANARRREMALSLIEIVTRAWRARRNQPPTFAEAEDWFLVRANTSLADVFAFFGASPLKRCDGSELWLRSVVYAFRRRSTGRAAMRTVRRTDPAAATPSRSTCVSALSLSRNVPALCSEMFAEQAECRLRF